MSDANIQKKIIKALRRTNIPKIAQEIKSYFPKANIYIVGGYLRDILINQTSKDIDLLVNNVPAKKLESLLKKIGRVNLVGKNFGVFKFTPKNSNLTDIDIALPRTDFSFGTGGRRDFRVQSDPHLQVEDDLKRRDFTINAMAWNILEKKLIDPFGGMLDLAKKVIKTVGSPDERFKEDYSRMLRAIRFSCQLNFKIETKTWQKIKLNIVHINDQRSGERIIPYEIIAKELLKSLFKNPTLALELLDESGALRALIPELLKMKKCPQPKNFHSEGDVWTHTKLALEILQSKKFEREFGKRPNVEIILATLLHDIGKPLAIKKPKNKNERIRFDGHDKIGSEVAEKIANRLKLSSYKEENIDIDSAKIKWLIGHHLLLISGDPNKMKATTIEKYFIRDQKLGEEFLAMQFADGSATIDKNGRPTLSEYKAIKKRIKNLLGKTKNKLPPPLLDGNEIMSILKIEQGPKIGKIIEELREVQLAGKVKNKKEAATLIKKLF